MTYLARKFNRAKWTLPTGTPSDIQHVQADAITSCLRTSSNTLSVWNVESSDFAGCTDVLAAIFSTMDKPDRADVILLQAESPDNFNGIPLRMAPGKTAANVEINERHCDIVGLTYSKLTQVANILFSEVCNESKNIRRYTKKETLEIVKVAVENGKVLQDKLSESWREALTGEQKSG